MIQIEGALYSTEYTCCSMLMVLGPRGTVFFGSTCSVLLVVEVTKQLSGPGLAGSRLTKTLVVDRDVKHPIHSFDTDLLRVMTGERVWWVWDGPAISDVGEGLLLLEEDKVLNPLSRKNVMPDNTENYQVNFILYMYRAVARKN